MFSICIKDVEELKKVSANLNTAEILNKLLKNEEWLEQVIF
jgi:hypothetical protein